MTGLRHIHCMHQYASSRSAESPAVRQRWLGARALTRFGFPLAVSVALQVAQRDNEIGILVSMLKRREAAGGAAKGPVLASPSASMTGPLPGQGAGHAAGAGQGAGGVGGGGAGGGGGDAGGGGGAADEMVVLMNTNLLADRNKAFELFRKSYRQNEVG